MWIFSSFFKTIRYISLSKVSSISNSCSFSLGKTSRKRPQTSKDIRHQYSKSGQWNNLPQMEDDWTAPGSWRLLAGSNRDKQVRRCVGAMLRDAECLEEESSVRCNLRTACSGLVSQTCHEKWPGSKFLLLGNSIGIKNNHERNGSSIKECTLVKDTQSLAELFVGTIKRNKKLLPGFGQLLGPTTARLSFHGSYRFWRSWKVFLCYFPDWKNGRLYCRSRKVLTFCKYVYTIELIIIIIMIMFRFMHCA